MTQKRIYNYFERNPELKVLFIFDKMGGIEADMADESWPEDHVYKEFYDYLANTNEITIEIHPVLLVSF